MSTQPSRWTMPATVVRWVDGDTLHVDASTSPGVTVRAVVRVYGIDTPEVGQPNHDEAKAAAEALAPPGMQVWLGLRPVTDKYGRWLATILNSQQAVDVGPAMIAKGLAVPYYGGTKGVVVPIAP